MLSHSMLISSAVVQRAGLMSAVVQTGSVGTDMLKCSVFLVELDQIISS